MIVESDCLDEYGEQKGLGRYRFIDHVIDEPFGMPEMRLLIFKCPFRGSSEIHMFLDLNRGIQLGYKRYIQPLAL